MRRLVYIALAVAALSGCATNKGMYDWGGYSGILYSSYKDPTTAAANTQKLEQHIQALEQSKQKVPPGLYADLGTMYLQAGDKEKAKANFMKEKDSWPESAGLMDALINNGVTPKAKEAKS